MNTSKEAKRIISKLKKDMVAWKFNHCAGYLNTDGNLLVCQMAHSRADALTDLATRVKVLNADKTWVLFNIDLAA